jgi:hypothetical protein
LKRVFSLVLLRDVHEDEVCLFLKCFSFLEEVLFLCFPFENKLAGLLDLEGNKTHHSNQDRIAIFHLA